MDMINTRVLRREQKHREQDGSKMCIDRTETYEEGTPRRKKEERKKKWLEAANENMRQRRNGV